MSNDDQFWLPVLTYGEDHDDDLTQRAGLQGNSTFLRRLKRDHTLKSFEEEIQQSNCNRWIIASEHLQARLTTNPEALERLQALLKPLFSEIQIVLLIRDPLEFALSIWTTLVLTGQVQKTLPLPGGSTSPECSGARSKTGAGSSWKRPFSCRCTNAIRIRSTVYARSARSQKASGTNHRAPTINA